MKNIRCISVFLCAVLIGLFLFSCVNGKEEPGPEDPGKEKSGNCDLLSFSLDGERNSLEDTIEFEIDPEGLTVTGRPLFRIGDKELRKLTPTFTIGGKKALADGIVVESGRVAMPFADDFSFVVVAENGSTKTYSVSLIIPGEEEKSDTCDLLSFSIDGESNNLESSVVFTIDPDNLTVTGTYLPQLETDDPVRMVPTFGTNGKKVLVKGEPVVSDETELSFADDFSLVVVAENGDTRIYTVSFVYTKKPDVNKSDTCDLLTFSINGSRNGLKNNITFDFNQTARTLKGSYLTWITGENPAMLMPAFTTNGEKVLVDGAEVKSNETKISFADDVSFVVVAENGETKTYTISLVCPQINTELPVLRLRPDKAVTSQTTYVNTTLDMYSPSTDSGWWSESDGQIQMRGRGNSTWGLPKKPYRLKFPVKYSPVGLDHAKEKDWVILAHDMDKSLLRNHIAFEYSRVMFNPSEGWHNPGAIMFTPCSQHVNIYWGDNYHGLYQMSDQMERGSGRIAVEKLTAVDGNDPNTMTGGHILETDIHSQSAPVRFRSSKGIQINHKYPDDDDYHSAQYKYIEDFVKTAEGVLYGNNFKDPDNGWRKYFDEKTMADFIIVKEFAGDFDGYTSTYMYKRRGIDKIFFGPIWDVDKGWDNDKRRTELKPNESLMLNAGFWMPSYVNPDWFHRVWQDEEFRKFVGARWAARKAALTAAAMKVFDEKPGQMAKSIEANFKVWEFYYQYSGEAKMPAATYELEIERMRALTVSRSALLDKLFK